MFNLLKRVYNFLSLLILLNKDITKIINDNITGKFLKSFPEVVKHSIEAVKEY